MYLIYLYGSGNTGLNLNDSSQPVFLLCAMAVAEDVWQPLEHARSETVAKHFPTASRDPDFEVHASDLRNGSGPFRGMGVSERIAARDEMMEVGMRVDGSPDAKGRLTAVIRFGPPDAAHGPIRSAIRLG